MWKIWQNDAKIVVITWNIRLLFSVESNDASRNKCRIPTINESQMATN